MYLSTLPSRFFPDSFFDTPGTVSKKQNPVNILEKDSSYEISVDLPGVKKEDVNIELKEGYLHLNAHRKEEKVENAQYHYKEIEEYEVKRSWKLSTDINEESIDAKLENGVLSVVLQKKEDVQPKQITVN